MIQETDVKGLLRDGDVYFFPNILMPMDSEKFMHGYNLPEDANLYTKGTTMRWGHDARYKTQTNGSLTTKFFYGTGYVVNQYGRVMFMSKDEEAVYKFEATYVFYPSGVELRGDYVYINGIKVDDRIRNNYVALDDLMKDYNEYTKDHWLFSKETLSKDFLDDNASTYSEVIYRPFRHYLEATILKNSNNTLIEPSTGLQFV